MYALVAHPCELRADLQRHYGIDLDHAMAGAHTCEHVAALVTALPPDCAINRAEDSDMGWTRQEVLLATIVNQLSDLAWGLGGGRPADRPERVGPSWMQANDRGRRANTRTMRISDLDAQIRAFEAMGADALEVTIG